MPVLRTGGVRQRSRRRTSELCADWVRWGFVPNLRTPGGELKFLWMAVCPESLAGAAEPILSKRLQGRKANVVNEAASTAGRERKSSSSGPAVRK